MGSLKGVIDWRTAGRELFLRKKRNSRLSQQTPAHLSNCKLPLARQSIYLLSSMKSRAHFIKQAAKTISENHGKHDESFIFGISGKWGEGKTRFLNELSQELDDFVIIKINPWKFAGDKTTFLRNLLVKLTEKSDSRPGRHRRHKARLNELYFDISENQINWRYLFSLAVIIFIAYLIYVNSLSADQKKLINEWKILISAIFLPLFLALAGPLVTTQRSSRSISTVDKFDQLLDEILADFENQRVVVFVDDLDRVTPQIAREVLDNLRTFFDKNNLTFVVTGDHTVLERYMGKELSPDDTTPGQLEEGRRFLKKIVNVYWRLPRPIDSEFNQFLQQLIQEKSSEIDSIFNTQKAKEKFQEYLLRYFDKNFRQVIRFVEMVTFTFQIINAQKEQADEKTKQYIHDLLGNPLLIVRILIIQDLCTPLFEEILTDYRILFDLEYAVEKKANDNIDEILNRYTHKLSPCQQVFIRKFVFEEPRFFKNSALAVLSIEPFLHLAADASFGDLRGPSPEDFMAIIKTGDPNQVKNALLASGEKKLNQAADTFVTLWQPKDAEISEKNNHLLTLLNALIDTPITHPSQRTFSEKLQQVHLGPLAGLKVEVKMKTYILFWQWLDLLEIDGLVEKYKDKFPFAVENLDHITIDTGGKLTSHIITDWLINYHSQDERASLNKMTAIFPTLNNEQVKEQVSPLIRVFVNDLITDSDSDLREARFTLIANYSDGQLLKARIFEALYDEDVWRWAIVKADAEVALWSRQELEQKLFLAFTANIDNASFSEDLAYLNEKIDLLLDELWGFLLGDTNNLLMGIFPNFSVQSEYQALTPAADRAHILFEKLVEEIKTFEEVNQKIQWLGFLAEDVWIWANLDRIPDRRKLNGMTRSGDPNLAAAASHVLDSWRDRVNSAELQQA